MPTIALTATPTTLPAIPRSVLGLDLENLTGDPRADAITARAVVLAFARAAQPGVGDLSFVAGNRALLTGVAFDTPFPYRLVPAYSGPDGADRALLERVPTAWTVRRFDRLVVGSGDHAFADLAEAAVLAGLEVVVVGRRGSIHHSYWKIGCDVRYLEDHLRPGADPSTGRVIPFPTSHRSDEHRRGPEAA